MKLLNSKAMLVLPLTCILTSSIFALEGDIDGNGKVDWDDINRTYWYFGEKGSEYYNPIADINKDNVVDATDAQLVKDIMNGVYKAPVEELEIVPETTETTPEPVVDSILGDIDGDGDVDWDDINRSYWYHGAKGGENYNSDADINKDDVVNSTDADLIRQIMDGTYVPPVTILLGDVDEDGDVDWDDINRSYWYHGVKGDANYNPLADIDKNDVVDGNDAELIKSIMNGTYVAPQDEEPEAVVGDVDGDGDVDYDDINRVSWYKGTSTGDENYYAPADVNNDGVINDADSDLVRAIMNGEDTSDETDEDTDSDSSENTNDEVDEDTDDSTNEDTNTSVDSNTATVIAGCQIFPANNFWNTKIIDYPLHPRSDAYINNIIATTPLHPDFGDGERDGNGELVNAYGIPFVVLSGDESRYENNESIYQKSLITTTFRWADESDCRTDGTNEEKICDDGDIASYPTPATRISQVNTNVGEISKVIESGTDSHLIALDADTCHLYEVQSYNYEVSSNTITNVTGDSGAIWDLYKNEQRLNNHTSADAAGLAILPGLIRFNEVVTTYNENGEHEYGEINHAIRITLQNPQNAYVNPATHSDGNQGGGCGFSAESDCLPMGQKLRLKMSLNDIDNSNYSEANKVILRALRNFGAVIADTGGDMFISGNHDPRWADEVVDLGALQNITASDFEAVIDPNGTRVYEYSGEQRSTFFMPQEDNTTTAEQNTTIPDFGDDEFEFVVFGDFNQGGCNRNDRVKDLIDLMVQNELSRAAFFVSTGDLIDGYLDSEGGHLSFGADTDTSNCGVGAHSGNLNKLMSPIKDREPFEGLNASFYPAIGNHDSGWSFNGTSTDDWYPDPWGQGVCDFLTPNLPTDYINHGIEDRKGGYLANIDTNKNDIDALFCNKIRRNDSAHPDDFYYSFEYKNSHFIVLSLYHNYQSVSDTQVAFLEAELSKAKNAGKHIFVFAHAPLYTTNWDRHRPTSNWRTYSELFDEYGVDVYFNGHNHSYERSYALNVDENNNDEFNAFVRDDSGTVYLTVGSAGGGSDGTPDITNEFTEVTRSSPDWEQVRFWSKYSAAREITVYVRVKVKGAQVSFETINIGLENLDNINSGGNLKPMNEMILGPRVVDTGSLRKYQ